VLLHLLTPGVEHAEEADLGAETLGIASDFEHRFGAESEKHVVDEPFILKCERSQAAGERKDDVSVGGRQDFGSTRLDPALSGIGLTLGTMPVAACNGELTITCLMVSISLWRAK
jgi:hypothetical protein